MNSHRPDRIICVFILLKIVLFVNCDLQDRLNLQHRQTHLPEKKFGDKDYAEYSDANERVDEDSSLNRNRVPPINTKLFSTVSEKNTLEISSTLDSNVKWDQNWLQNLTLGQLSAVDVDPNGNIAIFCRRNRTWDGSSFDNNNKFDRLKPSIDENVIILFDKNGNVISEWGKNMFYMPHGMTIDSHGNYWLTDVALHQVFKFDKNDITLYLEKMKTKRKNHSNEITLKASITLGVAFEPGNDEISFCKPTAVAIANNGDFFVSDGYCNFRIIKFNSNGERISQIGRFWQPGFYQTPSVYSFLVPHALALSHELNILFVADRENGRVLSYHEKNETFYKEYKYPLISSKVFSIAYANGKLFIINGHGLSDNSHVRGFIIDVNTGIIESQFSPGQDMIAPHDIAVNQDGTEIYVVELNIQKAYRFIRGNQNSTQINNKNKISSKHQDLKPLNNADDDELSANINSTKTVLLFFASTVILIGFCIAVAAVLAKCRKRGCLLVRRKAYWESEKKDNFKLSSLLEPRQGKSLRIFGNRPNTRDFSKLNTEPESSEDDLDDSINII